MKENTQRKIVYILGFIAFGASMWLINYKIALLLWGIYLMYISPKRT